MSTTLKQAIADSSVYYIKTSYLLLVAMCTALKQAILLIAMCATLKQAIYCADSNVYHKSIRVLCPLVHFLGGMF